MSVRLKYVGASTRYFDTVAGSREQWTPGRVSDVADAAAVALIQTGFFAAVAGEEMRYTAAQLSALAAAGGLTPNASYVASDTRRVMLATSASKLQSDPAARASASMFLRLGTGASQIATSTLQTSWCVKVALETDFDQVRVWFPNYNAATYTVVAAAVATTESWGAAGYADAAWQPYVNAAKITGLDSATDAYGWRSLNFSGSRSGTIAARLGLHADASTPRVSWTASDWTDCASVPNTDRTSTYPDLRYLILKVFIDGVATPYNYLGTQSSGTPRDFSVPDSVNQGRTYLTARVDGNTNIVTTPDTGAPSTGSKGPYLPCIIEYRSRKRGLSVAWVGDSLVAYVYGNSADGGTTDMIYSPVHRACYGASSSSVPMSPVNVGCAAKVSDTYQVSLLDLISAGIKPPVVIYNVFTPNDTRTTGGTARISYRKALRRLAEVADAVSAYGGVVIAFTPTPMEGVITAVDDERKWLSAQISAMEASNLIRVVDVRTAVVSTIGASPETWVTAYKWDSVHWNETAVIAVSDLFAKLIATIRPT